MQIWTGNGTVCPECFIDLTPAPDELIETEKDFCILCEIEVKYPHTFTETGEMYTPDKLFEDLEI